MINFKLCSSCPQVMSFRQALDSNIAWLTNKTDTHPQWRPYAPGKNLADETLPLVKYLTALNKGGLYTICSQPTDLTENVDNTGGPGKIKNPSKSLSFQAVFSTRHCTN